MRWLAAVANDQSNSLDQHRTFVSSLASASTKARGGNGFRSGAHFDGSIPSPREYGESCLHSYSDKATLTHLVVTRGERDAISWVQSQERTAMGVLNSSGFSSFVMSSKVP